MTEAPKRISIACFDPDGSGGAWSTTNEGWKDYRIDHDYLRLDLHAAAVREAVEAEREQAAERGREAARKFWNYPDGDDRVAAAILKGDGG